MCVTCVPHLVAVLWSEDGSRQYPGALGTQQRRGEAPALFAQLSLGPGLTREHLWGCS